MDEAQQFTIDELARETGVPSRTIRFYQSKGALPKPERCGRKALYSLAHVQRLKLIGQLQDRGVQIRAIGQLCKQLAAGKASLDEWLGVEDELRAPWTEDAPRLLSADEMKEFLGDDAAPGLLATLLRVGVVEQRERHYLVQSPQLLKMGLQLQEAGIEFEHSLKAARILKKHLGKAAREIGEHMLDDTTGSFACGRSPMEAVQALTALKPIALDVARLIFAHEIQRALDDALSQGALAGGKKGARGKR